MFFGGQGERPIKIPKSLFFGEQGEIPKKIPKKILKQIASNMVKKHNFGVKQTGSISATSA